MLAYTQPVYFKPARETKAMKNNRQRIIQPLHYRTISLDTDKLRSFLQSVPLAEGILTKSAKAVIGLPMPDGKNSYFRIWESSVMAPGLAALFPNLKTYTGQGITDSTATAKLDWTENGFHAMISFSTGPVVFIDPYARDMLTIYQSYFRSDLPKNTKDRYPDKVLNN